MPRHSSNCNRPKPKQSPTKKVRRAKVWDGRTVADIELPTGVALVVNSSYWKRLAGVAVMAYIGGRGRRGCCRNQITKRFNPDNFPSTIACIKAAIRWRRKAEHLLNQFTKHTLQMNITERAQKVLTEIDAALEMAEKATPGPWYQGCDLNSAVFDRQGRDIVPDCDPDDAAFIATSRTLLPASMRCLKTAIEGLLKTIKPFRFPDEDRPEAHDALTTLCDQWEAPR